MIQPRLESQLDMDTATNAGRFGADHVLRAFQGRIAEAATVIVA